MHRPLKSLHRVKASGGGDWSQSRYQAVVENVSMSTDWIWQGSKAALKHHFAQQQLLHRYGEIWSHVRFAKFLELELQSGFQHHRDLDCDVKSPR